MPVKIRLQRHGKKGKPFYWVVAADARAKRDGRYLEKIGTYNPNTNPATVNINVDTAVKWLENGAQPTDTARTLLSYRGVMLKHHLNGGVRKGAHTQEEADAKFEAWATEKEAKIQAKVEGLTKAEADERAKALAAEKEVNEKRIADAKAVEEEAIAAEAAAKAEAEEEAAAEEATEEAPAAEEAKEEVAEEATEEATEEAPAAEEAIEEVAEEATEDAAEDAPAAE
ncbi:MAG: 30S ribosomal protein S16 [Flavobacteriaceae bacterium]|nr:30S ribosomal protein S16 [Flavobacteriaceae bacterium]